MGAGLSSAGLDSGAGSGFASSFLGSGAGGSLANIYYNDWKPVLKSQRGDHNQRKRGFSDGNICGTCIL